MFAGSRKIYVVSLLATLAILFSSALVLSQGSTIQETTLISSTIRFTPALNIAPPVVQKQIQTSTAITVISQPKPTVVHSSPATSTSLPSGLLCIRGPWGKATHESGGNYSIHTEWPSGQESATTGGYQYDDPTWGGFMGYARAYLAPAWVQDLKASLDYKAGPQVRHIRWPVTSFLCGV